MTDVSTKIRPAPPGSLVAAFLNAERAETVELLAGMQGFPMRSLGRDDEAAYLYEAAVNQRFENGGSNLFGLALYPEGYRGRSGREADELLYDLFILNRAHEIGSVAAVTGTEWLQGALESGLLEFSAEGISCPWRLVPCGDQLFLTDAYSSDDDMVYLSNDSLFLAGLLGEELREGGVRRLVDLGTGSGILGCRGGSLAGAPVKGIDINPRAVAFARVNAAINDIEAAMDCGTYEDAAFTDGDFVIANPPFVFVPEGSAGILHSAGGSFGLNVTLELLDVLERRLPQGSRFLILTQSGVFGDAASPLLVDCCKEQLSRLDVEIENVGAMPLPAKFEAFYRKAGMTQLNQLVLRGGRGQGQVSYKATNRFEGEFCFG